MITKKKKATLEKSLGDLPTVKEPNLSDITSQGQGSYQESQGDMVTCQSEDIKTRINRHTEKFPASKTPYKSFFFFFFTFFFTETFQEEGITLE